MSLSVAVAVKVSNTPGEVSMSPIGANAGAELTSFTVMVRVLVSLWGGLPLSVTRTVTGYDMWPCASVGLHMKAPVDELIAAPLAAGVPRDREKVSV